MSTYSSNLQKVALSIKTVATTSLRTWHLARSACHNCANQKWSELSSLIELVRALHPAGVLEVGVSSGGTLALWSELADPHARLVGIDIEIQPQTEERIRAAMTTTQHLYLINEDSHAEAAKQQLLTTINGECLDFLFIDGDHSYEGVKQDWETYSPFVRSGGLAALHDIVPDYSYQLGIRTENDAGGVHKLWGELKPHHRHYEFVEDQKQNGYGIGVIVV